MTLQQEAGPPGAPSRTVIDTSGRAWRCFVVDEGLRWDPEIEMRRQSWLCCHGGDDRRYITPVPPEWATCSDADLLSAIARAKPDHRMGR